MKSFDRSRIRFALHGGAGDVAEDAGPQTEQRTVLAATTRASLACLQEGGTAIEAVALAVTRLEECPLFNAGIGAVLNRDGLPELDAAIMRGADRACGAVTCISRVRSPVQLAQAVLERTPHVLFAGAGAEQLAASLGLPMVEPEFFITPERVAQLEKARRTGSIVLDHDTLSEADDAAFGTVGAVARDGYSGLAAATSTGGLTNKLPGRIGDTPLIGVGTFADDETCAISCTGTGEAFIKAGFANSVHARIAWCGWSLEQACADGLARVRGFGGRGGCIAIAHDGELKLPFNSNAMYRAWVGADSLVHVAIRAPGAE